jgi:hypothetical protein
MSSRRWSAIGRPLTWPAVGWSVGVTARRIRGNTPSAIHPAGQRVPCKTEAALAPLVPAMLLGTMLAACGGGSSSSSSRSPPTGNPVPSISWVSPASTQAGAAAFTLIIEGANFISGSAVQWNGSPRSTTYVGPTQLAASIMGSDIATAGTASVTVVNPEPGGGTSPGVPFTVDSGSGAAASWPDPRPDDPGFFVDVASGLTSLARLNSLLTGPLFAAWDPANSGGPGMKIMFGGAAAACPNAVGPVGSFPDAVLVADGYPGRAAAVPQDLRFTPAPAASCSAAAHGKYGPSNVFLDGSQLWFYAATLGRPTDLLTPFPPGGVRQGASANLVNTSVNYQLPRDLVRPWLPNGRARMAALAQVVRIRAQDATAVTQSGQGMAFYVINSGCIASGHPPISCQMTWAFSQAVARSDVSDWSTATVTATVYADPVQQNLAVIDGMLPAAGSLLSDGQYGLPLLTSRGSATQHSSFGPTRFDVEIEFYQLENAIRLVSALTLGEPMAADAACAQCVQVFGSTWNDPQSWMFSTLVTSQEIYDESGVSGEILGGYAWFYAGAAP